MTDRHRRLSSFDLIFEPHKQSTELYYKSVLQERLLSIEVCCPGCYGCLPFVSLLCPHSAFPMLVGGPRAAPYFPGFRAAISRLLPLLLLRTFLWSSKASRSSLTFPLSSVINSDASTA